MSEPAVKYVATISVDKCPVINQRCFVETYTLREDGVWHSENLFMDDATMTSLVHGGAVPDVSPTTKLVVFDDKNQALAYRDGACAMIEILAKAFL